MKKSTHILAAKGLSLTYRGASRPSLENVSLDMGAGELFGLIGPNGAGKTTLISILSTLLKPSSGEVGICGFNSATDSSSVRPLIGVVPQDLALYPDLTGRENLFYYGTLYGLSRKKLKNIIDEYLDRFGLSARADDPVGTYSGGMKRRINLLAGILHKPRLLFLDEPTVGIDAQSRNLILEQLLLLRDEGISMIYTTHYMEEVERLCTRIAVIDEGRIIAMGHPGTLVDETPGCENLSDHFLTLTGKELRD